MSAQARLSDIHARIVRAAGLARRKAEDVTLVAVSKTHPAEAIRPLIEAGQRVFGENRVQEAEAKWPALREEFLSWRVDSTPKPFVSSEVEKQASTRSEPASLARNERGFDARESERLELHLVGQLQSNKAEAAVQLFDAIHSVDRPSLVEALARAIDKTGRAPTLFLQVNIGDEPQKGGCAVLDTPGLLGQARVAGLEIAGLMCVPPLQVEPAPYFALLAKMARDHGVPLLSMGMSDDFDTAVMLGATHVRVGSALFGARA